ncbi:Tol-Pal system beta propeller repeat protein TolB [Paracoccaceae bacterium]|nr:Tol-Pal system beta propeller repeat protein TolB [Paracoccaceae bacterium]
MARRRKILNLKIVFIAITLLQFIKHVNAEEINAPRLDMTVNRGVIKPISLAIPSFIRESGANTIISKELAKVISNNLDGTGLFKSIPQAAYIGSPLSFNTPVQFSNWSTINADVLVVGSVGLKPDGKLEVKFRLWDVAQEKEIGKGKKYFTNTESWRRISHKISDTIYTRITGEDAYFDSRVVFVSETGPKNKRTKRLAIMDQDGANFKFLKHPPSLVIAPRFSPTRNEIIYTGYETGKPRVYLMDLTSEKISSLPDLSGMSFAPRFSKDGNNIVLSITENGNTDIFTINLLTGTKSRLTTNIAIDTAPSFSPDGESVVFESDRGGGQQLYIIPSKGGEARRISFGQGRYATPVWSPRGDLIAFTKINKGKFHIGVMRFDGSMERLLTTSFLDEGPAWAPNGRVIMFFRETPGSAGAPSIYSIDISGRNLKKIKTSSFASDPNWSPILN